MIDRGVRLRWLGSDLLTWQDLWAIVACLRLPDSAILRAQMPKQWQWQLDGLLLADIADSLHWLVWAKSEDARRGRNRPRPIPRPGVRDHREHYGDAPMSIDAMNEFLGWEVV